MISVDKLFKKYGIEINTKTVIEVWTQPWRFYHNLENHLEPMLLKIEELELDEKDFDILTIAAIFHDWDYRPWNLVDGKNKDNGLSMEESSLNYLDSIWNKSILEMSIFKDKVFALIRATETMKPETKLEELFSNIDTSSLRTNLAEMIRIEKLIMKEYQFANYSIYKEKRIEFLSNNIELGGLAISNNIPSLIEVIKNRVPKIAVYGGSFNPFHKGHLNILEKGEKIFDKVIVAKGKNDSKNVNLEQFDKELNNLKYTLKYREVTNYDGLLTDFLKSQTGDITLIRGLRNGYDLEAENKLMFYMTKMYPQLKVIYIPCDKEYEYISSTDIRAIKKYGDFSDQFLP